MVGPAPCSQAKRWVSPPVLALREKEIDREGREREDVEDGEARRASVPSVRDP
jgi:hypothetical protein